MKLLVISDIHGNFTDAVLRLVSESDLTLCLGDLGPQTGTSDESFVFIKQIASVGRFLMIPGNCDEGCLQTFLAENNTISLNGRVLHIGGHSFAGYGGSPSTVSYVRAVRSRFISGTEASIGASLLQGEKSQGMRKFLQTFGIAITEGGFVVNPETPELLESWSALHSPCEFQESHAWEFLTTKAAHSDIWILHVPPFGFPGSERIGGVSIGSRGVLDAITAVQPLLTISGHIHRAGRWTLGRTSCLSAPAMEDNLALIVRVEETHVSSEVVAID